MNKAVKMKNIHFTDPYLLDPQHPVTVIVAGCGGTGSQVLTCLARMDTTLRAIEHPGLYVMAYDPDMVTMANTGRQLFSETDLGLNKAACLVTRINRFFGTGWDSIPEPYDSRHANIIITCTDNIASRLDVEKAMREERRYWGHPYERDIYWLDFGNGRTTGQVILGSLPVKQPDSKIYRTAGKLSFVTELFDYTAIRETDSGPSCSLAAAINKQDLFINSTLAQLGCNILWKLFREGSIENQGFFLNLDHMKVNPIKIAMDDEVINSVAS